jgi:RNase P protein component
VGGLSTGAVARRLPRGMRLLAPAEYAAVRAAKPGASASASAGWLTMTACWAATERPGVRLGLTISRKMARRAVDRTLVKRIVREAFRHRAAPLLRAAGKAGQRVDVVVRLKRTVAAGTSSQPSQRLWRRELRESADALLSTLQERVERIAADA